MRPPPVIFTLLREIRTFITDTVSSKLTSPIMCIRLPSLPFAPSTPSPLSFTRSETAAIVCASCDFESMSPSSWAQSITESHVSMPASIRASLSVMVPFTNLQRVMSGRVHIITPSVSPGGAMMKQQSHLHQ